MVGPSSALLYEPLDASASTMIWSLPHRDSALSSLSDRDSAGKPLRSLGGHGNSPRGALSVMGSREQPSDEGHPEQVYGHALLRDTKNGFMR